MNRLFVAAWLHAPRMLALVVAIACTILLQACASRSTSVSKDTEFSEKNGKAVVVFGVRIPDEFCPYLHHFTPSWRAFDPMTQKLLPSRIFRTTDCTTGMQAFADSFSKEDSPCRCQNVTWIAEVTEPGYYHMNYIHALKGQSVNQRTLLAGKSLFEDRINNKNVLNFHAAPGQVTYIGNFVFDIRSFPARISRYHRDDAGAKAYLAQSPRIDAPFIYVQPKTSLDETAR